MKTTIALLIAALIAIVFVKVAAPGEAAGKRYNPGAAANGFKIRKQPDKIVSFSVRDGVLDIEYDKAKLTEAARAFLEYLREIAKKEGLCDGKGEKP